jgi:hypothetical protein
MQKGTTPSFMRPFRVEVVVEDNDKFNDVDIISLLFTTGMSQSKAESKRLIEQNLIWLDNGVSDLTESTIWDRAHKVKLELNKFLLIEHGDVICIGKRIDEAVCHRIVFVPKT